MKIKMDKKMKKIVKKALKKRTWIYAWTYDYREIVRVRFPIRDLRGETFGIFDETCGDWIPLPLKEYGIRWALSREELEKGEQSNENKND